MSSAKHSLIANSADMDRSMESSHRGGAAPPPSGGSDGVRQGIAYVDERHDESFLHCCTTGLSKALSFVPCCWPALPFGCVPVNENEEQVLMVFGKFYDTLRQPGMHYGNPVIVSGVVSYRVINAKAAALDVENHRGYVMTQAQTILKQVVSRYPYESTDGSASLKTE